MNNSLFAVSPLISSFINAIIAENKNEIRMMYAGDANQGLPCATEGEKLSGACAGGEPPRAGLHADGTLEKLTCPGSGAQCRR